MTLRNELTKQLSTDSMCVHMCNKSCAGLVPVAGLGWARLVGGVWTAMVAVGAVLGGKS